VIQTKTSKQGRTRKEYERDKRIVLGADGRPVRRADPVISESDFEKVQAALRVRRRASPVRRVNGVALLLQVIFCGVCQKPMYAFHTNSGRPGGGRAYYRCSSTVSRPPCGNLSARLHDTDEFVTKALLSLLGDFPNVRRVYVPGNDHTDRIAEIARQLDRLRRAVAVFEGDELSRLLDQVKELNATRTELEAEPVVQPGYRYEQTDVLFRDHYGGMTGVEKNQWLRDHVVRITYARASGSAAKIDLEFGDFPAMVAAVNPEFAAVLDKHGDEFRRSLTDHIRTEAERA
jgi:site-specific DNA recombinase